MEYLVTPAVKARYYGASDYITAMDSADFQSANMMLYLAAQNSYIVTTTVGDLTRLFPIEITSVDDTIAG